MTSLKKNGDSHITRAFKNKKKKTGNCHLFYFFNSIISFRQINTTEKQLTITITRKVVTTPDVTPRPSSFFLILTWAPGSS